MGYCSYCYAAGVKITLLSAVRACSLCRCGAVWLDKGKARWRWLAFIDTLGTSLAELRCGLYELLRGPKLAKDEK